MFLNPWILYALIRTHFHVPLKHHKIGYIIVLILSLIITLTWYSSIEVQNILLSLDNYVVNRNLLEYLTDPIILSMFSSFVILLICFLLIIINRSWRGLLYRYVFSNDKDSKEQELNRIIKLSFDDNNIYDVWNNTTIVLYCLIHYIFNLFIYCILNYIGILIEQSKDISFISTLLVSINRFILLYGKVVLILVSCIIIYWYVRSFIFAIIWLYMNYVQSKKF